MIDLSKISGLPIALKDNWHIQFNSPLTDMPPTYQREFEKDLPVLKNPNIPKTVEYTYLGYRGLCLPEHQELVKKNHVHYDLTIMPPLMLGDEFNKTIGHYHSNLPGKSIAYPELYEVLNGHALFLIQKIDPISGRLISVYAIDAKAGDKVIHPPNYGHILINLGSDVLVTANWICADYKSLYEPIAEKQGMAYYVVTGSPYQFVKNPKYEGDTGVKIINDQEKVYQNFGFKPDEPMYVTAMKNPEKLEFLCDPIKHAVELSTLTS